MKISLIFVAVVIAAASRSFAAPIEAAPCLDLKAGTPSFTCSTPIKRDNDDDVHGALLMARVSRIGRRGTGLTDIFTNFGKKLNPKSWRDWGATYMSPKDEQPLKASKDTFSSAHSEDPWLDSKNTKNEKTAFGDIYDRISAVLKLGPNSTRQYRNTITLGDSRFKRFTDGVKAGPSKISRSLQRIKDWLKASSKSSRPKVSRSHTAPTGALPAPTRPANAPPDLTLPNSEPAISLAISQ